MSGVTYEVSIDGVKHTFKNHDEYQAWLRSKQSPEAVKLEEELKQLRSQESELLNKAKPIYVQIHNLEFHLKSLQGIDHRILDDYSKQLEQLRNKPEVVEHQKLVREIYITETKLQTMRSGASY